MNLLLCRGMIRTGNINWKNFAFSKTNLFIRRLGSMILLILVMIIMAVPSALVYNLTANVPYAKYFMDLQFIQNNSSFLSNLIVRYMPGLWNALINLLFLVIIKSLSRMRKYTDYISYQKFISRTAMFYLSINILLLPVISISANSSIIDLTRQLFTWDKFNRTFLFSNSCMIV